YSVTVSLSQNANNPFLVTATDAAGNVSGAATVPTIREDSIAPQVTAPANQAGNEGGTVSGVFVTATDAGGGSLTYSASSLPPGLAINPATGEITGTLTGQSVGNYTVTVNATDAASNTGSATFTWTVADVTTPTVTAPANQSSNEGDAVSG